MQSHQNQSITTSEGESSSLRWIVAILSLSMLLPSLGTSSVNIGLPTLVKAFKVPFHQVQWVVLAYLLSITSLIVSVGRLGDLTGRRRLMLVGLLLFTAASVLCSIAPVLWFLVAARAAQGLGAAILMALSMAIAGEVVPQEKTGTVMGLLGTMSAVGTALGPTLGGTLIASVGWSGIFLVNVPLGLVAFFLARRYLPADTLKPQKHRPGFDVLGTLLLALTLAAYAWAMSLGQNGFGPLNKGLLLAAALGFGLFLLVESRTTSPLIKLNIFQNPILSTGFAMSALVTTVVMATLVVGPFYLSGALALNAAEAGLVMSCGPIAAALSGAPGGRMVDKFGAGTIGLAGLSAMLIGSSLLALLPMEAGIPGYIAPLVIITSGYALFQAANNTTIMMAIQPDQRGVISALLNLSRNLGLISGASLMGAIFAFGTASTNLVSARPEAIADGLRLSFTFAAGLLLATITLAVISKTVSGRTTGKF